MRCLPVFHMCASALAITTAAALAEEVTVISVDGSVNVIGELVSSSTEFITIRTAIGEMRVPTDQVECTGSGCPKTEVVTADVVVRGSDTIGEELMPLLIEGYAATMQSGVAQRTPNGADTTAMSVRDDFGAGEEVLVASVQSAGSSTGFKALLEDETHVAMSSRPARRAEVVALVEQGRGNLLDLEQEYIIAVDSILTIVSPENPVEALSVDQIAGLMSGRYTNWSQVGGADVPVNVYARPETSGTRSVFEGQILSASGESLSAEATIVASNEEMSDRVTLDPGGIGYVGFAQKREAKSVDLIASCGIRMTATAFSAKTEEYPLERRLRLFTDNRDMPDHVRGLLDFAISSDADGLIQKAGFIDLGVKTAEVSLDMGQLLNSAAEANDPVALRMMRDMMRTLDGAQRLSTTFRFTPGSAELDNKAKRDLDRLIEFLQRPENAGREVMLVGYTDSDGAFSSNAELSISRANSVRLNLLNHKGPEALEGIEIATAGYGELSPVGCNDDFRGRLRNRRVEIWMR